MCIVIFLVQLKVFCLTMYILYATGLFLGHFSLSLPLLGVNPLAASLSHVMPPPYEALFKLPGFACCTLVLVFRWPVAPSVLKFPVFMAKLNIPRTLRIILKRLIVLYTYIFNTHRPRTQYDKAAFPQICGNI